MILLHSLGLVLLGVVLGLLGGAFRQNRLNKKLEDAQKNTNTAIENAYHSGFEAGMEKTMKDLMAKVDAHERMENEKITKLAESMTAKECGEGCSHSDEVDYTISLKTTKPKKKTTPKKKKTASKKPTGKKK